LDKFEARVDGKLFDFSEMVALYGSAAAERLAHAWQQQFVGCTASTSSAYFRAFCRFLRWVAQRAEVCPDSAEAVFVQALQFGQSERLKKHLVFEVGEAWAARLRDIDCFEIANNTNLLSRKSLLEFVTSCLKRLSRAGLWADPGRFTPVVRGQLTGRNIPSFGELNKVAHPAELRGRVQPKYDQLDWHEVIRLNEERLCALRAICVRTLRAAIAKWEAGQTFIAAQDLPTPQTPEELLRELNALHLRRTSLTDEYRADARQRGLAMMVRYLALVERHRRNFDDKFRHNLLAGHVTASGGWGDALAHVEGDIRSLLAAQCVVMIDTAFNVSTCDQLAADPFVGEIHRGKVRVVTVAAAKLRARGEIQEGTLWEGADIDVRRSDDDLSGADAIRVWQKLSERIRATARHLESPVAEHLWILPGYKSDRDRIGLITTAAVDHHWQAMLRENFDHPVIGGLPLRRQMIRPTVLQLEAARANFEHTVAAQLAQHKNSATTMRYLSRPWFEALLASKMRMFLNAFEAGLMEPIEGAPDALGTSATHQSALDHARSTGLGFLCTAPLPAKSDAPSPCTSIDKCADCGFRQFRPSRESIRALVLFQRSLTQQEEPFKAANPARWAEVWLNFQALCDVIIDRLQASHHRRTLGKLEAEIDAGLTSGTIKVIGLW
jgi:hypothetical protein